MAGAYCRFCGNRCFVYREVIVGGATLWAGHMATCSKGAQHTKDVLGITFREAHNPHSNRDSAS